MYLDFTTTKETRTFESFIRAINRGFSEPKFLGEKRKGDKTVVSYDLQSIGDSMVVKEDGRRYSMNYSSFVGLLAESNNEHLKECLKEVGELFTGLKANDVRFLRIVAIHTILNAFVDYADPDHLRTEKHIYYLDRLKGDVENIKKVIGDVRPESLKLMSESLVGSYEKDAA